VTWKFSSRLLASLVAGGALAALATAGVLLASPSTTAGPTRMHLVEVEIATSFIDEKPQGVSPGDHHTISSDVFDMKHRLVGRADFDCVVTGIGKRLGGLCESVEAPVQAITGGTGAYKAARGQFVIGKQTAKGTPFVVELTG
jgi:hypothetical protein